MRKIFFSSFLVFLVLGSAVFSMDLPELFEKAKEVNSNYVLSELALEKASMEYDKAIIESSNRKTELNAEISLLNGKSSVDKYLKSFYTEIIGAVFSVRSAEKALEVAKLNYDNSKIDFEKNQGLFNKALLSKQDFDSAKITLDEKVNSLNKAQEDYDNLLEDFNRYTGIEWSEVSGIELETPDYRNFVVDEKTWFEKSYTLVTSEKNLEIADYDLKNLYVNSSEYTKRSSEISKKQKEIDFEMAEISLRNDKRTSEQGLENSRKQLETLNGKLEIERALFKDMEDRYGKELVSVQQYNQQKISLLNAEKQVIDSQKSYWSSLITYLFSIGKSPEYILLKEETEK